MGHWSWNPFHRGAGCTFSRSVLDRILPFITKKSQHGLEGKAELTNTWSHSHKSVSYEICHWAGDSCLVTLLFSSHEDCPGKRLLWELLPSCLQIRLLHSVWVKPKDLLCQACSARPHLPLCPGVGSPRLSVVLLLGLLHKPPSSRHAVSHFISLTQPSCPQTSLQKDEPKEQVSLLIVFLNVELQL